MENCEIKYEEFKMFAIRIVLFADKPHDLCSPIPINLHLNYIFELTLNFIVHR